MLGKKQTRKQSSISFDMSVRGYNSWADRYHLKPVVAGMLIFTLVGGFTWQNVWAFFGFGVNAQNEENLVEEVVQTTSVPLVSLILEKDLLEEIEDDESDYSLEDMISLYEKAVESSTRAQVVKIWVDKTISPRDIWEGNQALYANGHPEIDGPSHLIGTILIGDLPLPVVDKKGSLWQTPYPYTDFDAPVYSWDEDVQRFVFTGDGDFKPEIWHGIINHTHVPEKDEGLSEEDQSEYKKSVLRDWFMQNYLSHGKEIPNIEGDSFAQDQQNNICPVVQTSTSPLADGLDFTERGVVNDVLYDKRILVIDQDIAKRGIDDDLELRYNLLMENLDDVVYLRQNKHWNKAVLDAIAASEGLQDETSLDGESLNLLADNQTKAILDALLQHYESYFSGYLSKITTDIERSGKYSAHDIDTPMGLITQVDLGSALMVKNLNAGFEGYLLRMFEDQSVASDITIRTHELDDDGITEIPAYWNGVLRSTMDVEDCSLLRGYPRQPALNSLKDSAITTQMAEMNRVFNDTTFGQCGGGYNGCCADNMRISGNGQVTKANCNVDQWATNPIFDLAGGAEVFSGSIGASACAAIIETDLSGYTLPEDDYLLHTFDSFMIHDEPRVETILAQVENKDTIAMPIDNPRGVSFYNDSLDFYRFNFVDWFELRSVIEETNSDKQLFIHAMRDLFVNKIEEFNSLGGGASLDSDPLGDVGNDTLQLFSSDSDYDDGIGLGVNGQLIFARLSWLEKDLEEKHHNILATIFTQGDKAGGSAGSNNTLLNTDFGGYEMILYSTSNTPEGVMTTVEGDEKEPTQSYLDRVIEDSSFQFEPISVPIPLFGARFDEDLSSYGEVPCAEDLPLQERLACQVQNNYREAQNVIYADGSFSSANEIVELVSSLELVQETDVVSSGDKSPHSLLVRLLDKDGSIITNDSHTEVTLTGGTGYSIGPLQTVTAQRGEAQFILVPQEDRGIGNEFFEATVTRGGTVLVSNKVKIETVPYQLRITNYDEPTVLSTEGVSVQARFVGDRYEVMENRNDLVEFRSETGSFIGENPTLLIDGRASVLFVPDVKAETVDVTVDAIQARDVAPGRVGIDVAPGDPVVLRVMDRPAYFLENDDFVPVSVAVTDIYGNIVLEPQNYTWTIENGRFEQSTDRTLQQSSIAGKSTVFIRPNVDQESVFVQVVAQGLPSDQGKRLEIAFLQDVSVEAGILEEIVHTASDTSLFELPLRLSQAVEGNITVPVYSDDSSVGVFPKEILFQDGKGLFSYYSSGKSGSTNVIIGGNGIDPLAVPMTFLANQGVKIIVEGGDIVQKASQEGLENSETERDRLIQTEEDDEDDESRRQGELALTVKVVDEYGNIDTSYGGTIDVYVNEVDDQDDFDAAGDTLVDSGVYSGLKDQVVTVFEDVHDTTREQDRAVKLSNRSVINIESGVGTLWVSGETVGNDYLSFVADGLISDAHEVRVETTTDWLLQDVRTKAQSIFALGWNAEGEVAHHFLMNESNFCRNEIENQVQAFVSTKVDLEPTVQYGYISPNGHFSDRLNASLQTGDEYSVYFALQDSDDPLLKGTYVQNETVRFIEGVADSIDTIGITLENEQTTFIESDNLLLHNGVPMLEWDEKGSIIWKHDSVLIEFPTNNLFEWNIYSDYHHLAFIQYGASQNQVTVQEALEQTTIEGELNQLIVALLDSDIESESVRTMGGLSDKNGLIFSSVFDIELPERRLGFIYESIEDDGGDIQSFFGGDWKPGTLFSAGNSVGESVLSGASDNVIVYGDPTTRSTHENLDSSLGISDDLGELVYSFGPEEEIQNIIDIDFNGDAQRDLLVFSNEKSWIIHQDSSEEGRFLPPKTVLRPDQIDIHSVASMVFDDDSKEDLVTLHSNGGLYWYKNMGSKWGNPKEIYIENPKYPLKSFQKARLEDGPRNDMVVEDANGTLWGIMIEDSIVQKEVLFDDFAPEIQTMNESFTGSAPSLNQEDYPVLSEFMVQFLGIEERVSDVSFEYEVGQEVPITSALLTDAWRQMSISAASAEDNAVPGTVFDIRFVFETNRSYEDFVLTIPGFEGMENIPGSWECDGCNDSTVVVLDADGLEIKADTIDSAVVEITWQAEVSSLDPLRYIVEDFAGDDGFDDIAVAKIISGQEKIIQFTTTGSGVVDRDSWTVSNAPVLLAQADTNQNASGQSEDHVQSVVSPADRVDVVEPFDPDAGANDSDGDGIPDIYDMSPNIGNTINPSQTLDVLYSNVPQRLAADVTAATISSNTAGEQSVVAANESVGPISSDSGDDPARNTIFENAVSQETQQSIIVGATYACGDPRCGTKVESSAPSAPGAATIRNDHEASPGAVGIGSAIYWTPRDKKQIESSMRLYRGSTNTGKGYTVVCRGKESNFLDPNVWNPNCTLSVVPTTASAQSCGVTPGNPITTGSNQASANFLMDQSNNLFANDQGAWNDGTKQAEPDTRSNITLKGADIIGTWAQNSYRALSRWKLPRLNLIYPKLPPTDNVLQEVHLHHNVTNSTSHNLRTQSIFIPYPQIDTDSFERFETDALEWIEKTEIWIQTARFLIENAQAEGFEDVLAEAEKNVVVMRENIDTVRGYLDQKEVLFDLQDTLRDVLSQIQANQDAIEQMYISWVDQIQNDMIPWFTFRKNLQSIFESWEVHSRRLDSFTRACSGCGVTRSTLIEWLIRSGPLPVGIDGFQNDGAADVFPLTSRPPDVTLDMSRIVQGNNVPLLDLQLQPVELAVLSVPAFYEPLREGSNPAGIGNIIALPKIDESVGPANAVPGAALQFPRFLSGVHTPTELKSFFTPSGENLIPAPPEDFIGMQKNLVSALKVHTQNFAEFCKIMQGQSFVPEWFVRPNIELVTNRQSFLPRDWVRRSRNPVVSEKSTEDRVQYVDFNLAYSGKDSDDYYRQVNNHVESEYGKMSCLVQNIQYAFATRSDEEYVCDPLAEAKALTTAFNTENVFDETIAYDYEDLFNSTVFRSESDTAKEGDVYVESSREYTAFIEDLQQEKIHTTGWTTSTEEVPHHESTGDRSAHIFYFDKETGQSDRATTYNLNRNHAGLMVDLNNDNNTDIVIGDGSDLYVKYQRRENLDDPIDIYPDLSQSEEDFVAAHPPIANTGWHVSSQHELVIPTEHLEKGYTEWQHVDRVYGEDVVERMGLYRFKPSADEIQKQPVVLQSVRGDVDIQTKAVSLPLHSVRACSNPEHQIKLTRKTNILGTIGTSRVLWKDLVGNVQEIILRSGESITRSVGTVCATSGKVYLESDRQASYTTTLSNQVPITHLSEIKTKEGSGVELRLSNGFVVSIPENQRYTISVYSDENIPAFVRLQRTGNASTYGQLVSATDLGISTTVSTGLHQNLSLDDIQAPSIEIQNGIEQTIPLYESFVIDASQTTDNDTIESVWWDFDSTVDSDGDGFFQNDNDFPGWGNEIYSIDALLRVSIPGQSSPTDRSITIYVQDEVGNIASEEIALSFEVPTIQLLPVSSDDVFVQGEGSIPKDVSAQLWRQRLNGDWTLLDSISGDTTAYTFLWNKISTEKGLELSGDTADVEVLANGRMVVDRGAYTVKTNFASQNRPFGLQLETSVGDIVGGVVLALNGQDVSVTKNPDGEIKEGITLASEIYTWKEIEGSAWGDNAYALVDTKKDITYAIFDQNGQLYDVQDGMFVSLDSSSNSDGPLSFSIFDEAGVVIGSVVINTSDLFLKVQK